MALVIYIVSLVISFALLSNLKRAILKKPRSHVEIKKCCRHLLWYSFIPAFNTWYVLSKINFIITKKYKSWTITTAKNF